MYDLKIFPLLYIQKSYFVSVKVSKILFVELGGLVTASLPSHREVYEKWYKSFIKVSNIFLK